MATADEQIRVSGRVKRELDRRRREGESYNDVLERILEDGDRDLLAGFGRWSDEHAERVREAREKAEQESKERMRRLTENSRR
jgi:predicted CopG family antitoxin